ncbi:bacitracin ABC transporter permease BceB [Niallia circulans]|jgi:bacitracin transport system permease protein|uniref:ABC transporter permease n=1 Tax=Niallia TaxID=2837506 RepID=UPI00077CAEED|nr:ABC transporter permease [Niallia circulans]MDR4316391.1 ABC transporter permease [Niallia circulans]MED3838439.1 ABC transporter permease [Niallia circulans]MED4243912.1 ABC transporter permease [Niallia circulans]MED4246306.1 ABC transporter permease [Niallia circulans]QKH63059.1 ABC transporter permease [Niallia circulans]
MTLSNLVIRNLKKNIKYYYLYIFALVFSVSLYFSFVTLQYDPSMDVVENSVKGGAAIKAASVLLIAIVAIFLLYANTIFIKRRGKEIGLFQLIGMTKSKIFRLLTLENFILYFLSIVIGIFIGVSFSKITIMILFKVTGVQAIAKLHFSPEALVQTVIVFCAIYVLIMLMNYIFIKRQTILSLFRVASSTEARVKKMSVWEMIIGVTGIIFIISGYYISSQLFNGDFQSMNELFFAMISILALVIIGTYLFYKGSVSFLFNLIRKGKNGYININQVLSLSSIMFRMKSNAILLTIITTVSALALGFLCLSYISYYSAEKNAKQNVPADFAFDNVQDAEAFTSRLEEQKIAYKEEKIPVIQTIFDIKGVLDNIPDGFTQDTSEMQMPVISEDYVEGVHLSKEEVLFDGYSSTLEKFIKLKSTGSITMELNGQSVPLNYLGMKEMNILPYNFSNGGLMTVIVDSSVFDLVQKNMDKSLQSPSSLYIGININKNQEIVEADKIYQKLTFESQETLSRYETSQSQKEFMGLAMFIVGFLGLTFLITSGCILYFKQMDEGEEEKYNYTILRKLGYTQNDLINGIKSKQLFNFGIPLLIGLLHSYFAVKSGWFFFGSELWAPMFIVMGLYALLYSIFGILSVIYYKKIISEAL